MYAVTKTYKDFNGVERTETKLFNLTETEVMEMELGTAGGVAEMLQRDVYKRQLLYYDPVPSEK